MDELITQLAELELREREIAHKRSKIVQALSERLQAVNSSLGSTHKPTPLTDTACNNIRSSQRIWQAKGLESQEVQPGISPTLLELVVNSKPNTGREFILVLINGNAPEFVMLATAITLYLGYFEARLLIYMVRRHFRVLLQEYPETEIIIQVLANLERTKSVYVNNNNRGWSNDNVTTTPVFNESEGRFMNEISDVCILEDSGIIEEETDLQIDAIIQQYHNHVQCKRVVLSSPKGGNGTTFIGDLVVTSNAKGKFTLLDYKSTSSFLGLTESIQFRPYILHRDIDQNFKDQTDKYKNECWKSSSTMVRYEAEVKDTWSQGGHHSTMAVEENSSDTLKDLSADGEVDSDMDNQCQMYFNKLGQRVDSKIAYDRALMKDLQRRRVCWNYALDRCHKNGCSWNHHADLTAAEFCSLRMLARVVPCISLYCRNPCCIAGHQCFYNWTCTKADCHFSKEMHQVDTEVVETVSTNDPW